MIEKLTPKQEAKIPEYLEKFRAIGLNTSPCDRPAAEAAIRRMAKYLKQKKPVFFWYDSPVQAAIASGILETTGIDALKAAPTNLLPLAKTYTKFINQASSGSYGSFEAYWVSYYSFIVNELDVEHDDLTDIVTDVVSNTGFYIPYDGCYLMSERPVEISFNEQNQLHNEHKPALLYKDNTGVFAINGTRLPMTVLNKKNSPEIAEVVMKISNVTARVIAQRFVGMDKFLSVLKPKVIDKSKTEAGLALIEFSLEGTKQRALKMVNPSTGEIHVEFVSPKAKTVTEADAFRQGEHFVNKYGYVPPIAKA